MMKSPSSRSRRTSSSLLLCALCTLGASRHALADNLWWKGGVGVVNGANGDRWTDLPGIFNLGGTNFTTDAAGTTRTLSTLPTAATDVRFLTSTPVSDECLLGRDFTINSLIVNATPSNVSVFIGKDVGTNHTLTLASPGITMNNTGTLQLACNLNVTNTTSLAINVSSTTGTVAATGTILAPTIVKSGAGILKLGDPLTATGPSSNSFTSLIVNDGNVEALVQNTIPVGCNLTVNSGSITLDNTPTTVGNIVFGNGSSGSTRTIRQSALSFPPVPTLTLQGNISFNGPGDPAVFSTPVALSAGQHLINNPSDAFSNSFYDIVFDGSLSGPGGYTKSGRTYMVLTESSTHTGATIIDGGRVYAANFGALSQSSALTVDSPGQLYLNPTTSTTFVTAGNYGQTVSSLSGNGTIFLGTANLTVSGVGSSTFSGVISGTGALIKNGSSTLILSGDNAYSGGTTISGGRLQLGDGGASGSVPGNILNNAFLTFNRGDTYTYPGTISGTGSLTKAGVGTVILPGSQTYSGGTTISAGTLQIGNGGTTGSIPGNVTNNGNLTFSRSDNLTFPGIISGSGSLTKFGGASLILPSNNTYAGPTTIDAGIVQVGTGTTTGSIVGNINVNNNSILVFFRLNTSVFPTVGNITGTGSVSLTGGTLTTGRIRASQLSITPAGTLTIAPNSGVSKLSLLILNGNLDLTNNDLIITNQAEAAIRLQIAKWWNNGARNGGGLLSSLSTTSNLTTLGLTTANKLANPSVFESLSVNPTDLIVKYTYLGDTNLDGVVNATDLTNLMKGIRSNGALTGWANGDTNYDGLINGLDYANLVTALRFQSASLSLADGGHAAASPIAGQIPEPSSLAALALLGLPLSRRRRA